MSGPGSEPFKEFIIKKEKINNKSKFELKKEQDRLAGPPVPSELRQKALQDFDNEVKGATEVAKSKQSGVDDYLKNAGLLLKSGDYKLAQNILKAVLKKEPRNEIALRGLAESFVETQQIEVALDIYHELIELNPSFINLVSIGDAYYRIGKDSSASHWYFKALDTREIESPILFDVYKNLGNIAVRSGDLESAEENYNKAFTINPDSDVLLVNYGTLEIQRGNFDAALERYREAAELNDNNEKAWVGLALIHREHGDHSLSWANLEKALDIDPTNETALRLIVDWSYRDNKIQDGILQLEKYIQLAPGDIEMRTLLAQFLVSMCRYKHARKHILVLRDLNIESQALDELETLVNGALNQ